MSLVEIDSRGLYCAAADLYIDPWEPVERAVITHAHPDRARPGSTRYLTARSGEALLKRHLGEQTHIQAVDYRETLDCGGVRVSLHPAGHLLGSAQVRLEYRGEVWVFTGDFNPAPDATCAPFEPLPCHVLLSEATFGLPIFRWTPESTVFSEMNAWWRSNREAGATSLLFVNSPGPAERVLAGVDRSIGPVYVDQAIGAWHVALVLAPPSLHSAAWVRRFGAASTAFASGWMRIRGTRRRRSLDRGFVLSGHADWSGLNQAIAESGAERVWITHGFREPMARWLRERGLDAQAVATRFADAGEDE